MPGTLSLILPARNEAENLARLLPKLRQYFPEAEILVVDDASTDETARIAEQSGAVVLHHPYRLGNGAAIKTGARQARGEILVFLDADGQHTPEDIPRLLEKLEEGYDMAVGARQRGSQTNAARGLANRVYNLLASYMTGQRILDLTSGFRAARAEKFRQFLYLLPNGFSYPTTITMAFFRAGYSVAYVPIHASPRQGKSHIRPLRDGVRFLVIIFRIGTLYAPIKLFGPVSFLLFISGLGWYLHTFWTQGRFTNMSALLFTASLLVFLMGLISEQITLLLYKDSNRQAP